MEISVRQGEQQAEAGCRFRQGKAVCRVAVHAGADQTVERGADVGGEDIESARLCNNIKPIRGRGDRKRIIIVIYLDTDIIRCGFKGKNVGIKGKNVGILIVKPQTEIAASLNDGQAEAVINAGDKHKVVCRTVTASDRERRMLILGVAAQSKVVFISPIEHTINGIAVRSCQQIMPTVRRGLLIGQMVWLLVGLTKKKFPFVNADLPGKPEMREKVSAHRGTICACNLRRLHDRRKKIMVDIAEVQAVKIFHAVDLSQNRSRHTIQFFRSDGNCPCLRSNV